MTAETDGSGQGIQLPGHDLQSGRSGLSGAALGRWEVAY